MLRFCVLLSVLAVHVYGAEIGESDKREFYRFVKFINKDASNPIIIENMTLTHVLENGNQSPVVSTFEGIPVHPNGDTPLLKIQLPTERTTDYWFITVRVGSKLLTSKTSFNCNMDHYDYGITILYITIFPGEVVIRDMVADNCKAKLYWVIKHDMDGAAIEEALVTEQLLGENDSDLSPADGSKASSTSFSMKYAKFIIENKFGSPIIVEKLTHYLGNNAHDPSNTVVDDLTIEANGASKPYDFAFANGFLPPRDYWYVRVRVGTDVLHTKSNFYCNMTSDDTGTTKLSIDIMNKKFHVIPPVSSSCTVSLL